MGLALAVADLLDLGVDQDAHDAAVGLDLLQVRLDGLLALAVLLRVPTKGLLLALVPARQSKLQYTVSHVRLHELQCHAGMRIKGITTASAWMIAAGCLQKRPDLLLAAAAWLQQ